MEESLKFNSAICTTKEQSKRLLELGLSPYTSDMCWLNISDLPACAGYTVFKKAEDEYKMNIIPAWSLHRLMEILNPVSIEFSISTLEEAYEDIIYNISESIKNGYINKEYLKQ